MFKLHLRSLMHIFAPSLSDLTGEEKKEKTIRNNCQNWQSGFGIRGASPVQLTFGYQEPCRFILRKPKQIKGFSFP